jgi:hypothetical protein
VSSLTLPPLEPMSAEDQAAQSDVVGRVYQHCAARPHAPFGQPYMSWRMDLRRRDYRVRRTPDAAPVKLERWVFTPHMNDAKAPVAARFEFSFADRDETCFLGEFVEFSGPQPYLSGNEFERTFPPSATELVQVEQWNLWGRGPTASVAVHYEEVIHPRVVETIGAIAARQAGRPLVVADLGGGSGSLGDMICDGVPQVRTMLVVDGSPALVQQAQRRAAMHPGRMAVREADITAEGFFESVEAPDVIVMCGVVAVQVMQRDTGLRLVRRCHEKLPPGGFALIPSFSPALLASEDYLALGFVVHNMSLSLWEKTPNARRLMTNDYYVLEKAPHRPWELHRP